MLVPFFFTGYVVCGVCQVLLVSDIREAYVYLLSISNNPIMRELANPSITTSLQYLIFPQSSFLTTVACVCLDAAQVS